MLIEIKKKKYEKKGRRKKIYTKDIKLCQKIKLRLNGFHFQKKNEKKAKT